MNTNEKGDAVCCFSRPKPAKVRYKPLEFAFSIAESMQTDQRYDMVEHPGEVSIGRKEAQGSSASFV